MQDDGGEDERLSGETRAEICSTASGDVEAQDPETRAEICSTSSGDVDMLEVQDPETAAGSGTHLGGVVTKVRAKVKHSNASEKVTVDVLSSRILDYGLVKPERATNLVWHYFRKFCPKKLTVKRPAIDPLRDHTLYML
jgi:hypothetical protein